MYLFEDLIQLSLRLLLLRFLQSLSLLLLLWRKKIWCNSFHWLQLLLFLEIQLLYLDSPLDIVHSIKWCRWSGSFGPRVLISFFKKCFLFFSLKSAIWLSGANPFFMSSVLLRGPLILWFFFLHFPFSCFSIFCFSYSVFAWCSVFFFPLPGQEGSTSTTTRQDKSSPPRRRSSSLRRRKGQRCCTNRSRKHVL